MPRQPEARMKKKLIERLEKKYGGVWVKIVANRYQARGIEDIVGCLEGLYIGLEAKIPGKEKTLKKAQADRILQVQTVGKGASQMVTSFEQACEVIDRALAKHKKKRIRIVYKRDSTAL